MKLDIIWQLTCADSKFSPRKIIFQSSRIIIFNVAWIPSAYNVKWLERMRTCLTTWLKSYLRNDDKQRLKEGHKIRVEFCNLQFLWIV